MKLGLIIKQGTQKEVTREFDSLLEKAKEGYKDLVCVSNNKTFKIETESMSITFMLDKYLLSEYAIYQIIN